MAKLIDITGKALSGEWGTDDETGDGIPVLRTTNFTNVGVVDYSNVVTRTISKKNIDEKFLRKGDIIIEKSGGSDKFPVGRVVYFDGDENTYLFNNFTGLLRVNDKKAWYPKYVFYSLFANYRYGGTRVFENKTTGLHNLKIDDYVSRYEVEEVGLSEQILICNKLDKLYGIIQSTEQELQLLDMLIKARFIEMFGDPFDTTKWTVKELKDLSDSMVDGSNVNPDYYQPEGEVLFLRIQNVWRNELRLDDSVYITQEINKTQYYDTSLRTGDLLITKIGRYYTKDSSLGRVSVYRGKDDCANYSNNIMRVRLNRSVNSEFVNVLLNLDEYQSFIKRTSKGGTDKRALSKSLIGNYPIILPPEELQKRFASIVQQIDKSKFYVMYKLNCIKI